MGLTALSQLHVCSFVGRVWMHTQIYTKNQYLSENKKTLMTATTVRVKLPVGKDVGASFLGRPPMVDDILHNESIIINVEETNSNDEVLFFAECHCGYFVQSLEIPGVVTVSHWECSRHLDVTLLQTQNYADRILVLTKEEPIASPFAFPAQKHNNDQAVGVEDGGGRVGEVYRIQLPTGVKPGLSFEHIPPVLAEIANDSPFHSILQPGLVVQEYTVPQEGETAITMGVAQGGFTDRKLTKALSQYQDVPNRVLTLARKTTTATNKQLQQQQQQQQDNKTFRMSGNFDWLMNWNSQHMPRWSIRRHSSISTSSQGGGMSVARSSRRQTFFHSSSSSSNPRSSTSSSNGSNMQRRRSSFWERMMNSFNGGGLNGDAGDLGDDNDAKQETEEGNVNNSNNVDTKNSSSTIEETPSNESAKDASGNDDGHP